MILFIISFFFFNLLVYFAAKLVYLATLQLLSKELKMFTKLKFITMFGEGS